MIKNAWIPRLEGIVLGRYGGSFQALKQALVAKGAAVVQADQTALAMMYGLLRRQAGALAFNHIFWIIGVAFLSIIPLLLLLKRPTHAAEGGMGH